MLDARFRENLEDWVWSPLDFGECNSMIREESFRLQQDMLGKNKYIQESHTAMENSPIFWWYLLKMGISHGSASLREGTT